MTRRSMTSSASRYRVRSSRRRRSREHRRESQPGTIRFVSPLPAPSFAFRPDAGDATQAAPTTCGYVAHVDALVYAPRSATLGQVAAALRASVASRVAELRVLSVSSSSSSSSASDAPRCLHFTPPGFGHAVSWSIHWEEGATLMLARTPTGNSTGDFGRFTADWAFRSTGRCYARPTRSGRSGPTPETGPRRREGCATCTPWASQSPESTGAPRARGGLV